jgi:hypothetical protein
LVRGRPRKGADYIERSRVNYRLEPDLVRAIKSAADRKGISQTAYVELVLRDRLEKDEKHKAEAAKKQNKPRIAKKGKP